MEKWLQDFRYSIEIGFGIFLLAGGSAILIALLTVSFQAVRAAMSNPADAFAVNNKKLKNPQMLKNYFKIAIRNFQRYFGYTIINVAGLAVGLATVIFILLWVTDELSYDSFHKNKSTLYRVWHNATYSDGSIKTFPSTPAPLAPTAKVEIPEIENAVRIDWGSSLLFEYEHL